MAKKKKFSEKFSALDPRFREKLGTMFKEIIDSVYLLYETAIKDGKTGLYNAKFFDTILEMEIEKAQRGYEKLSLFVIDIDFFKKINDKHGHIKADEFLVRVSKIIEKTMRKSDVVSRFGGEEFFILLPETGLEKAKKITSRLRTNLKKDMLLKKYNVTVSGGLTEFHDKDNKKKFMSRADKALYKAKNTGRDKFVIF